MRPITILLARPEDAHDFADLTQNLHDSMRPTERIYATCGAVGYQRMSRDGFLDTALQNASSPPTMCAVALRATDPRHNLGPTLECLLIPVRNP